MASAPKICPKISTCRCVLALINSSTSLADTCPSFSCEGAVALSASSSLFSNVSFIVSAACSLAFCARFIISLISNIIRPPIYIFVLICRQIYCTDNLVLIYCQIYCSVNQLFPSIFSFYFPPTPFTFHFYFYFPFPLPPLSLPFPHSSFVPFPPLLSHFSLLSASPMHQLWH